MSPLDHLLNSSSSDSGISSERRQKRSSDEANVEDGKDERDGNAKRHRGDHFPSSNQGTFRTLTETSGATRTSSPVEAPMMPTASGQSAASTFGDPSRDAVSFINYSREDFTSMAPENTSGAAAITDPFTPLRDDNTSSGVGVIRDTNRIQGSNLERHSRGSQGSTSPPVRDEVDPTTLPNQPESDRTSSKTKPTRPEASDRIDFDLFMEYKMNPDHLQYSLERAVKDHRTLDKFLAAMLQKRRRDLGEETEGLEKPEIKRMVKEAEKSEEVKRADTVERDLLLAWEAYERVHNHRRPVFEDEFVDLDKEIRDITDERPYKGFLEFNFWKLQRHIAAEKASQKRGGATTEDIKALEKCIEYLEIKDAADDLGVEELHILARNELNAGHARVQEARKQADQEGLLVVLSKEEYYLIQEAREKRLREEWENRGFTRDATTDEATDGPTDEEIAMSSY